MDDSKELKMVFWFTVLYLILFTGIAIVKGNYEFLYYTAVMSAALFLIVSYNKKIHLPKSIIFGLSMQGFLHILGGNLAIAGTRLYDVWIFPYFKYDNFMHFTGIFIATLIAYNLIYPHLDRKIEHNPWSLALLLILIASGIGAFNEILELGAVVFFDAAEQVGDYMNNAIDLVYNLAGSIAACFFILKHHKRQRN